MNGRRKINFAAARGGRWKSIAGPILAFGTAMVLVAGFSASVWAAEIRSGNRIKKPGAPSPVMMAPGTAGVTLTPVAKIIPVERRLVKKVVKDILSKWNTPGFKKALSSDFKDKEQLVDSIQQNVPRNAKLRLLAIESVQTLSQAREGTPGGQGVLVSRVSVVVRLQLEFNNPIIGFQRLDGRNEMIINIRQSLARGGLGR